MLDTADDPVKPNGRRAGAATEADAFLQSRLALLGKLFFLLTSSMLVLSIVLLGLLYSWGAALSDLGKPHRILYLGLVALFGVVWWVASRWRLRRAGLLGLDALTLLTTSVLLALMTAQADTSHTGAMELLLGMLLGLIVRAVIIPASGRHTLVLSLAGAVLGIACFAWRAAYHPALLPQLTNQGLRDTVITMALWMSIMAVTAAIASRIIFGLRREISLARRVGQYELIEKIGEGGMGVVYRATHAMLRRDTALKLLPRAHLAPDRLARFEREVRQTARLTHPNTVAIFDYGRTPEGIFYYAMEYLDGIDLERLVSHERTLPVGRAVHVLRQVLLSLTEAHEMGLVHRDIKPANVILTQRGGESDVVKVVDFGLVKDLRGAEDTNLTGSHAVTGTPLYMAPEAIRSPDDAGPSSDLYAVAALAYYLVTGTHVFSAETIMEICAHHLHSTPEPPSIRLGRPLPEALERIILTGLQKSPEQRFASARAFRDALASCPEIAPWTEQDARAWWAQHRADLGRLRQTSFLDQNGRTIAVDLRQRG